MHKIALFLLKKKMQKSPPAARDSVTFYLFHKTNQADLVSL